MRLSIRVSRARLRTKMRCAPEHGVTLVEQALILPVLLALMFGVIDMSRALYTYHYVSYIAREATRWASVRGGGVNGKATTGEVQTFVSNVSGMGLDPAQITATTTWKAPPNGTPLCSGASPEKPGCIVQVKVDYNFKFVVPFMPNGFTMSSTSQMIITQ